jgi:hypothetical protein
MRRNLDPDGGGNSQVAAAVNVCSPFKKKDEGDWLRATLKIQP